MVAPTLEANLSSLPSLARLLFPFLFSLRRHCSLGASSMVTPLGACHRTGWVYEREDRSGVAEASAECCKREPKRRRGLCHPTDRSPRSPVTSYFHRPPPSAHLQRRQRLYALAPTRFGERTFPLPSFAMPPDLEPAPSLISSLLHHHVLIWQAVDATRFLFGSSYALVMTRGLVAL